MIEDFRIDIVIGAGPRRRRTRMPMPRFTIIGATTRQGLISAPLRGRFGLVLHLKPYDVAELTRIVTRSARAARGADRRRTRPRRSPAAAAARRASPTGCCAACAITPQVRADGHDHRRRSPAALDLLEVDRYGLDEIDQKIMLPCWKSSAAGRWD